MKNVLFITLLVIITFFVACKKQKIPDQDFCSLIDNKEYDKTKPIVDLFLKTVPKEITSYQKLEKLANWYKSQSCIAQVEIVCNSCIYTNPPLSELKLVFVNKLGIQVTKIVDIYMSDYLSVKTHHD
jgi:hypothetical protein